jgi:hypothetical protein
MLARFASAAFAILFFMASVAFAQPGGVKGKVRTMSGNSIPNARITLRSGERDVRSARADARGQFQISGVAAGTYSLLVEAEGFSSGMLHGVEVRDKKVRDLGDRLMLSVDQGTQVIVRGSVFYKEGTSLGGAKVELEEVLSNGTTRRLGSSTTNISGEFTFRRPPGAAKLRVTARFKGVEGSREVEVETAAIYRLAITLDVSRTEK